MRLPWPRRWRREPKPAKYVAKHRPGSWGQVALPPVEPAEKAPEPLALASASVDPAPVAAPMPVVSDLVEARSGIRLGFADGSHLDFADDEPTGRDLQKLAGRLLGEG